MKTKMSSSKRRDRALLKQRSKALQPGSLLKPVPSHIFSPPNQAQAQLWGHLHYVYSGICPTFLSNNITGAGAERAARWGKPPLRDAGKGGKI